MGKIVKWAVANALGATVYVVLVAVFMFSLQQGMADTPDVIFIPIAMLMLLVFSAALMGVLVFGRPVMLYLDGKKKEAVSLLGYTLGILLCMTLFAFLALIFYYRLFI